MIGNAVMLLNADGRKNYAFSCLPFIDGGYGIFVSFACGYGVVYDFRTVISLINNNGFAVIFSFYYVIILLCLT